MEQRFSRDKTQDCDDDDGKHTSYQTEEEQEKHRDEDKPAVATERKSVMSVLVMETQAVIQNSSNPEAPMLEDAACYK